MRRLLVADDSETVLFMLRKRLELAGYDISTATNGREVLDSVAKAKPFDVILLDAMMPEMSGIEALASLRESGDTTPVIVISAHRYGDEPEEAKALGADDALPKPFDWDLLIEKIEELSEVDL